MTAQIILIYGNIMDNIMVIVKYVEESGSLNKGLNKTIKNEAKGQKGEFLIMLMATLGASLLKNILAGIEVIQTC